MVRSGATWASVSDFGTGGIAEYNGDIHNATAEVAELIHKWQPEYIITQGDNRYEAGKTYEKAVGKYYCDFLSDVTPTALCPLSKQRHSGRNGFYPSTGNHDYKEGGGIEEYKQYFTLPGAECAAAIANPVGYTSTPWSFIRIARTPTLVKALDNLKLRAVL